MPIFQSAPTYSDEYLERWGNIYVANHYEVSGIPFEKFLLRPQVHMVNFMDNKPPLAHTDPLPLLPTQSRIQRRMQFQTVLDDLIKDGETDHQGNVVELHGDHLVAPIHHHDAPKKWKTNTRRKHS